MSFHFKFSSKKSGLISLLESTMTTPNAAVMGYFPASIDDSFLFDKWFLFKS